MRIGIYTAAMGARAQEKRLDIVSNNIANAATPGFKKEVVSFEDFLFQTSSPNLEQGSIKATGNPLDIALSGEGFLKVQTNQGVLYTRGGNLTLNRDGTLITQEGWPVLGKGGPISITSRKAALRIETNGQVFDGTQNIDSLDIVKFPPKTAMVRVKNGYFKPADPQATPSAAEGCGVQQEALEEANFNVVQEMTQMIDAMRHFEAYHKIIQSFEQVDSQLVSKLANLAG
jgi:flagellar basal-body rod protein FlgF